ncbi:phosphotransferase [Micromonospora sp. BQ11]|uniref:phosphotransferase n=1 Tax=Micromonospora sp. BQ11 TaxID=3452212 RepID=UPI003F8B9A7C
MTTALSDAVASELHGHLRDVCAQIDVDPDAAKLVKYTMNAVFVAPPFVIRLAAGPHAATLAYRVVSVAACLEKADMPTVRLAPDLPPQPIFSGEWVATVWQYVPTVSHGPKPVDLAAPLRALHSFEQLDVSLPRWSPIEKFRRRLDAAAALSIEEAAELERWSRTELGVRATDLIHDLRRRCDEAQEDLDRIAWRFQPGVIHGDAHTGNVLLPADGHDGPARSGPLYATWTECASARGSGILSRPPMALPGLVAPLLTIRVLSEPTDLISPPGRAGLSCAESANCSW